MAETLTAYVGYDGKWQVKLRDESGADFIPPAGSTVDAMVWSGDQEITVFAPLVSLVAAGSSPWIDLTIPKESIASTGIGTYLLRVGVTTAGIRSVGFNGFLEIQGSAGAGVSAITFCEYDDILLIADQIGGWFNADVDQTGFAEQREDATSMLIEHWTEGYRVLDGFIYRRVSVFDHIYGYDRPDPSLSPPTRQQFGQFLKSGRLVVDTTIRTVTAMLAAAMIFDRQEVNDPRSGHRERAKDLRDRAMMKAKKVRLAIDTSQPADGIADLEYTYGAIYFLNLPETP